MRFGFAYHPLRIFFPCEVGDGDECLAAIGMDARGKCVETFVTTRR
jgi:hypothetical protein